MKKLILIISFLLTSVFVFANSDEILGTWITEKAENGNQIIVEIYNSGDKINGRVKELTMRYDEKGELKKDVQNPNESLRSRTIEGIDFVYGFNYNDNNKKYENGKIYHPGEGKTYACYMKLKEDGRLEVRGHIAHFPLLGKTQIWTRYKK